MFRDHPSDLALRISKVADFRNDFQDYLDALEYSPLKDLQALIDFNWKHAEVELPPGMFQTHVIASSCAIRAC